jgi:hypothetical protein
MPFLVTDDLDARENRIMGFLEEREPVIAILLAAADFERTVRRAILGLSTEPTKKIRKKLASEYGAINKYPWRMAAVRHASAEAGSCPHLRWR